MIQTLLAATRFKNMDKRKVIYYSDELNDEFSSAQIDAIEINEDYEYGNSSLWWKIKHFFVYRIIAYPIAFVYAKFCWHHTIVNRQILKPYKKTGYFIFGNHTNNGADAVIPSFVNHPKTTYVIVHPDNVSIPGLGKSTAYMGAIPLPGNMSAAKNFMDVLKLRIQQKAAVTIYPEAHIWPYYTKIRPFTDVSFRYPVQHDTPVFCFTNTYQKRRFGKKPKIVTYVDGPFFAGDGLSQKEKRTSLRNQVYEAMCKASEKNEVEVIKYIKKSGSAEND